MPFSAKARPGRAGSAAGSSWLLCLLALSVLACGPSMDTTPQPVSEAAGQLPQDAGAATEESPPAGEACGRGVVLDDGSVETGYGFVPSAVFGEYIQAFAAGSFPSRDLAKVCVCWLKTRHVRDVDFEVVFYEDLDGSPADVAYASIPASAEGLPDSVATAGRFFEVDVSGISLPPGRSFIGVRWNPSQGKFLFVCTDTSEETQMTEVFFREDRSPRWTQTVHAKDPIFLPHRAILLRAESQE